MLNSYQWYGSVVGGAFAVQLETNGAETNRGFPSESNSRGWSAARVDLVDGCRGNVLDSSEGRGGAGENASWKCVVSSSSISRRLSGSSHGGGMMFIRRCRLSSNASHKGVVVRDGGVSGFVAPQVSTYS